MPCWTHTGVSFWFSYGGGVTSVGTVLIKPVSISPDNSWLSLAESDRPVAMLFLELNAESSPTTAAILHATTSGKITSDLQGNSTREIKGDTG